MILVFQVAKGSTFSIFHFFINAVLKNVNFQVVQYDQHAEGAGGGGQGRHQLEQLGARHSASY